MGLDPGSRIGPYYILEFASDPDWLARFEREARAINHVTFLFDFLDEVRGKFR